MKVADQYSPIHQNHLRTLLRVFAGLALLAVFCLILIPSVQAQSPVDELATLEIELWPDFDRPAVLVLLTGTLADDTPTPATVTLPLPEGAEINAVAYVNVSSGAMENISERDSNTSGKLTFTTPSPTFRIEYYAPYGTDGDRRDFTFDWQSELTINQVLATVQQPANATNFELSPAAARTSTGQDGLVYHAIPGQALAAGQSFSIAGSYKLTSGQLSVNTMPAVEGPLPLISDSAQAESPSINWPLVAIVAGGLIIIAAVAWFLYTNSNTSRKRTPRPRPERRSQSPTSQPSSSSTAQFCHNCGQAVDTEDRFCRACGTVLKGR